MKKILLVADTPGWIFDRHCHEFKKRLTDYQFEIIYRSGVKKKPLEYYDSFDLIYILDSRLSIPFNLKHKTVIGIRCEFSYDHSEDGLYNFVKKQIESRASAFHVVNYNQYLELLGVTSIPLVYSPHGIDSRVFKIENKRNITKDIVVGINGSRKSGGKKGFDIVESACQQLGLKLVTSCQDFANGHLSKDQMPDFYKSIDVYCNMSETEGLNNSIMEAGAMGCMIIATPVGAAPEMIRDFDVEVPDLVQKFWKLYGKEPNCKTTGFLCKRSVNALVEKLKYCNEHKNDIVQYGENLSKLIHKYWSWDVCIENYDELFKKVLDK